MPPENQGAALLQERSLQSVHGHENLFDSVSVQVPEGDIDTTDRVHRRASPTVAIRQIIHPFPGRRDVVHVLAHHDLAQAMAPFC